MSSSSVTSRRVWPDSMPRRSAVSTSSVMSTVTTAGIGVITCRASCSCRWKTPESIVASSSSSMPPASDSRISRLSSSGDPPREMRRSGSTPSTPSIAFEATVSTTMNGWKSDAEPLQRPRDQARDALRAVDRVELRHHLADRDLRAGDQQERDRDAIATASACLPACRARARRAGRARARRARRCRSRPSSMPTWHVEMYSVMCSSWRSASLAPRRPCSAASSRREWRARTSEYSAIDEERVQQHQRHSRDHEQPVHGVRAAEVLRGGSSFIRSAPTRSTVAGAAASTQPALTRAARRSRRRARSRAPVTPPAECVESVMRSRR